MSKNTWSMRVFFTSLHMRPGLVFFFLSQATTIELAVPQVIPSVVTSTASVVRKAWIFTATRQCTGNTCTSVFLASPRPLSCVKWRFTRTAKVNIIDELVNYKGFAIDNSFRIRWKSNQDTPSRERHICNILCGDEQNVITWTRVTRRKTRTKQRHRPEPHVFHIDPHWWWYRSMTTLPVLYGWNWKASAFCIVKRNLYGGWEIWIYFLAALIRKILFSPLENKINIFAPPYNNLNVSYTDGSQTKSASVCSVVWSLKRSK